MQGTSSQSPLKNVYVISLQTNGFPLSFFYTLLVLINWENFISMCKRMRLKA